MRPGRVALGLMLALGAGGCAVPAAREEDMAAALDQALRDAQASLAALDAADSLPWLRQTLARQEREAAAGATPASAETASAAGAAWSAGLRGTPSELRDLMGAPAPVVEALFGPPLLRRAEGDGQAWLYRGRDCFLDVFLYREAGQRLPHVIHASARSPGFTRIPEPACVAGMLRTAGRGA